MREPPVPEPAEDELVWELLELAVPHEDVNAVLAARAVLAAEPAARRVVAECAGELAAGIGTVGESRVQLPLPPAELGELARYFPVLVYLAVLPRTRDYHRRRGIPETVSRRTLADLGRNMALHRRRYGTGGLRHPSWPAHHVRGELYQLGRLQFQRARLGTRTGRAVAATGAPYGPGTPSLAVHIPDCSGPLTPAACARSIALAREFFTRHFPEEPPAVATCESWLLDRQLRDHLPADANLIRFQDLFHPGYPPDHAEDTLPLDFVFADPDVPLDGLPRTTTLQRALIDHLRAGGHWYPGNGWFEL